MRRAPWISLLSVALLGAAAPALAQQPPPASPHGTLAIPCADCHSPTGWKPARISSRFDHGTTGFGLDGGHTAAACLSCHTSLDFQGVSPTCAGCHQDVHLGQLGAACAECHTASSFIDRPRMYRRHQLGRFPLDGPHAAVDCAQCHRPAAQGVLQYANLPTDCGQCHQAAFRAATNPNHVAAAFATTCTDCHARNTWVGGHFDHGKTQYPLVGAHTAATCQQCHADGTYRGRDQSCVSCHVASFDATTTPPHRQARFPTDCTLCHSGPTTWAGAAFDHDAGGFPLVGAHRALTCENCHAGGAWSGRPTTCAGCHQADYDATRTPDHRAASFALTCTDCHTQTGWPGATFDHGTTSFPLTGGHRAAACLDCHADGVYRGRMTTCVSCHQPEYDATTAPNHQASSLPLDCTQCHSTAGWSGASFDHGVTRFPLTGGHRAATCLDCHADGVYRGRSIECVACHRPDYDATTQPNHAAASLPLDCSVCHSTGAWGNVLFNHSSTQFPLTGAHVQTDCASCHTNGTYRGTPTTCAGCHQAEYAGTTNPPHQAAGFPTDCVACHTTTQWPGAVFQHDATQFPLTGAHRAVVCQDCHADGVYRGKLVACFSCHQPDYDATLAPPHQSLAFPTDCRLCHSTTAWPGGSYDHNTTSFPLTGAHIATACISCHIGGVYRGTAATCAGCHQSDFNGTTNPNHRTAMFPTDCLSCHTTITWLGARFDHDAQYFPIYSGAHRGKWGSCATCHTNNQNYAVFTCLSCHEHRKSEMDSKHQGRTGYQYVSTACLACHPRGTH